MNIISKMLTYLKKRHKLVKFIIIVVTLTVILLGLVSYYKGLYEQNNSSMHSQMLSNEALTNQNAELNKRVQEQQQLIASLEQELKSKQQENAELLKNAACSVTYPDTNYLQSKFVWNYLKNEIGLNDYVAAGIMGNIMTEVGGQTLDISLYSCRESNGGTYYGICQWAGGRKERLLNDFGRSLEDQCKFLHAELFEVIPKDNSFYDLQDEQEAALYFAKTYERCATWSYARRQTSATRALEYFTGSAE